MIPLLLGAGPALLAYYYLVDKKVSDVLRLTQGASKRVLQMRSRFCNRKGRRAKTKLAKARALILWMDKNAQRLRNEGLIRRVTMQPSTSISPLVVEADRQTSSWANVFVGTQFEDWPWPKEASVLIRYERSWMSEITNEVLSRFGRLFKFYALHDWIT